MKNRLKIVLPVLFLVCAANFVCGQNEIVITRPVYAMGNTKPIPVSLDGFRVFHSSRRTPRNIKSAAAPATM